MKYINLIILLCFTLLAINFVRYPLLNISSIFSLNIPENNSKIEVSELLKKAADYCRKLESSSLFFVCKEKIIERIYYSIPEKSKPYLRKGVFTWGYLIEDFKIHKYIYDYQLIRVGDYIQEKRDLLEEDGKKQHLKNAPLKTKIFENKYVLFGPIGLISNEAQNHHEYKLIKEEKINGLKCLVLHAIPRSSSPKNHLFGKVWVSKEDGSILKIHWDQESIGNYEKILEIADKLNAKPNITLISEYNVEKKGIRFPSTCYSKEEYIHPRYGNITVSETQVSYSDYRYFVVETEVKFRKDDR